MGGYSGVHVCWLSQVEDTDHLIMLCLTSLELLVFSFFPY